MNSAVYIGKNPFFIHDFDKLCGICHRGIGTNPDELYKFHDNLPSTKAITVLEALGMFSNVNKKTVNKLPPNICKTCFGNTYAAYKFHVIWSRTVSYLEDYLNHQEMQDNENPLETKVPPLLLNLNETELEEPTETKVAEDMWPIIKPEGEAQKKLVKCNFCQKSYHHTHISNHRRTHTGEKPHSCKICSRKFTQWTTLKRHEATHEDVRPYLCKFCGKGFKNQSDVCQHEKIHNVERRYKCEICDKRFTVLRNLKDHYIVHSDEKKFTCEVCAKSFGAKKHLRQHMITHAEVKRHVCHLCEKRFTQAHSLRTHLTKHCKGGS